MWLWDLLPGSSPFDKSRIMKYGYNSSLVNSKLKENMRDWANGLLHGLNELRKSDLVSQQSLR
jgi:hypothetical protein